MEMSWNKLDPGLASRYLEFVQKSAEGKPAGEVREMAAESAADDRIRVSLQYAGDLALIEAVGFETVWSGEQGHATGIVRFADLERISAHPGVLQLMFGAQPTPSLDVSVPDVRANLVWTRTGATFNDRAGQGVVIGVIDYGHRRAASVLPRHRRHETDSGHPGSGTGSRDRRAFSGSPLAVRNSSSTEHAICVVDLPEELFDFDYADHDPRRIETVSICIPCVAGSAHTITCSLRLLKNRSA